jgi:spore germination protein
LKIHVVKPGDNPWSLSKLYGVDVNRLIEANGLKDLPRLIVGQALFIPSPETRYRAMPGDSLWNIASKFEVSVRSIAEANIAANSIETLRVPTKPKNFGTIETNGFIQPSNAQTETSIIKQSGPYLTYSAPFSYHVDKNGSLIPIKDETILKESRAFKVAPMLSVTNLSESNFDTPLIDTILSDQNLQEKVISNIENTLKTKGFYGVIVDFERISPKNRDLYNNFLRKLVDRLHKSKFIVATALAPKTSDVKAGTWHGAHDYKAHGEIVDFVILMTYEWGWSGGPPLPVAPIDQVTKVISYAVSVIPAKKIMMSIPLYGYDWTLPYKPGGKFAKSIGMQEALNIAINNGATIKYSAKSQSPFFNYFDKNKLNHIVWFEDARSIVAKYMLVNQYGLRGVSYWQLRKSFPQNFEVLDDMFRIVKVIP